MSVTKPKFKALKKALKAAGISFKPVKSEFVECAVRVDVRTPRTEQLAIAAWITVVDGSRTVAGIVDAYTN